MRMKKEDMKKIYQLLELIYPDKSKEILKSQGIVFNNLNEQKTHNSWNRV